MNDQSRGFLLILFASVCLSTVATAVKLGLADGANPLQLLAPRMLLGAGLLWLWVGLTRPHRRHIDRSALRACVAAGSLNALTLWLFYLGLERVDVSVAILLFSSYPVMLLLMLHLRGESVTRRDLVRLTLAVAGVALVADPGGDADLVGVAYVLGCAAAYSLHMLVVHTRLVALPAATTTLWIVTVLAVAVVLARPFTATPQPLGWSGVAVVVWSGVVGTTVARLAMIEGIRKLGSGQTALLLPIETMLSIVWAALLLGERINATQTVGAALVLTSVALATFLRGRPLA